MLKHQAFFCRGCRRCLRGG